MLVRNGPGDQDGIIALGGFVNNNANNSSYAQQYFVGLLDYGFWHARPKDGVGLLFTYFAMSGALGKVQAEQLELGIPISNSATGIQTNEMIVEVNYNIHVYRGVDFRPEFQYIVRPNAQSNYSQRGRLRLQGQCGILTRESGRIAFRPKLPEPMTTAHTSWRPDRDRRDWPHQTTGRSELQPSLSGRDRQPCRLVVPRVQPQLAKCRAASGW